MNKSDNATPAGGNGPLLPSWLVKKDGAYFYRGEIPFDQLPFPDGPSPDDAAWAMSSPEIHRQYQGLIIAVRDRKVWGAGKGISLALEDARRQPGCPPENELELVSIMGMPGPPEATEGGDGK